MPAHDLETEQIFAYLRSFVAGEAVTSAPEGIDWPRLIESAYHRKVAPAVYQAIVRAGHQDRIPPAAWAEYTVWMHKLRQKNMVLAAHLNRLLDLLEAEGIPVLVMKGAVLASALYGDLALRQFEDIDLLVPPEQAHRALRIVVAQGFQLEWLRDYAEPSGGKLSLPPYEYHFKMSHPTWGVNLEIHWKVAWGHQQYWQFDLPFATLQAHSAAVRIRNREARTFSPEAMLILLAIDTLNGSLIATGRLVDCALLLKRYPDLEWPDVWALAERLGIKRVLTVLLCLTELVAPVEPPRQDRAGRLALRIASAEVLHDAKAKPLAQFRLEWALRQRRQDKLAFARHLLREKVYRNYIAYTIALDVARDGANLLGLGKETRIGRLRTATGQWFNRRIWPNKQFRQ